MSKLQCDYEQLLDKGGQDINKYSGQGQRYLPKWITLTRCE